MTPAPPKPPRWPAQASPKSKPPAALAASRCTLPPATAFPGGYARSSRSISAVAFTGTGTGMERDWAGEGRIWQADLPSAESIGQLAAERALARPGSTKPKTGTYPVLFDERIASSLIGHLIAARSEEHTSEL